MAHPPPQVPSPPPPDARTPPPSRRASGVRVEHDGMVTTVTLDRPERRNAVDGPTAAALAEAFRAFDADDGAHVAVLYGDHGTFCAGADLAAVGGPEGNRVDPLGHDGPMGPTRMRLSKPVVAAIEGYAVAGGLELAIWCDLRVAAQDAVLGVFCRRWGVPLVDGGTVRLPRLIGTGRAMDLVLTGRAVRADEAERIGLVDRVVPTGTALQEAQALARQVAAHPQRCARNDRLSLLDQEGRPEQEALERERVLGLDSLEDVVAGLERFRSGEGRHGAGT